MADTNITAATKLLDGKPNAKYSKSLSICDGIWVLDAPGTKTGRELVSTCLELTISEQSGDATHLRPRLVRRFRIDPELRP